MLVGSCSPYLDQPRRCLITANGELSYGNAELTTLFNKRLAWQIIQLEKQLINK